MMVLLLKCKLNEEKMEKEFLEQIAKDHAKNILTRDDAKTF